MAWLTANWFWVVILIAFIAMHMFGHGGHGSHGGHGGGDPQQTQRDPKVGEAQDRAVVKNEGGHQH